jgi:hypothetical protein
MTEGNDKVKKILAANNYINFASQDEVVKLYDSIHLTGEMWFCKISSEPM